MAQSQLSVTAKREGTTLRLSLSGEFARAAAGRVERVLEDALRLPTKRIVFDLSAVSFLDLAALRTLLSADERARDHGRELTVVRPSGAARRVFTLTRLGDVLTLRDRDTAPTRE